MATGEVQGPTDQKGLVRELAKRRAFIFLFIPIIITLAFFITLEQDMLLHALDDYVIISLSIISLILIGASWKKQSLGQLKKQHNIIFAFLVIALAFQIFGVLVEAGDSEDFGNEVPSLVALILMFINRFL